VFSVVACACGRVGISGKGRGPAAVVVMVSVVMAVGAARRAGDAVDRSRGGRHGGNELEGGEGVASGTAAGQVDEA